MTKSTFTTSLSPTYKLPSTLKSTPDNSLPIMSYLDARHEDDNLKELAIEEDCYEHSNAGSGISAEIASTHKKTSLFREKSDSDARSEYDNFKPLPSEPSSEEGESGYLTDSNNVSGTSGNIHCLEDKTPLLYASPSCLEEESGLPGTNSCLEDETGFLGDSPRFKEETGPTGINPCWDEGISVSETQAYKIKEGNEYGYSKPKKFTSEGKSLNPKKDADSTYVVPGVESSHSTVACLPIEKYGNVSINTADIQLAVNQKYQDILVEDFGHPLHPSVSHVHDASRPSAPQNAPCKNKQLPESLDKTLSGVDKRIFVMGGYDGVSWLPTMECYIPPRDIVHSLKPMNLIRSNAAAAVLNGYIYNVGGWNGYDGLWYDTVECYSPSRKEWISFPPLNEKKGGLACAALSNKIFAIGGGNGVDCFRAVEMFEPVLCKWIPAQSMLHKRFASAAAELDGVLYVVGGYDGTNYLKYAMGGHDGTCYLPSVEIFEPRKGSWVPGDEMKVPRGHFVAPVIEDAIYAIGGQTEGNYILDWVETYRSYHGWSITKLKGIGASSPHLKTVIQLLSNMESSQLNPVRLPRKNQEDPEKSG